MPQTEITKISIILLIASLLAGFGGWSITLDSWGSCTDPKSIGGLFVIIGGVLAAWIGKSPLNSQR